ncbi:MAG: chemotaxis protein CheW [Thermodesulfovibrio sp.]|uniref:chemotaxis protein CheW n=1 Tax=unclassified Thermodesulfovibrio TaxID=2645936 RepID=UPI00083B98DD|nr:MULTISPECIES: chemotaxis protein CheW [unclassified Thermodesulfovibrio]MDI1470961.1 chemotaxis protein CheW [Thermodesulfovibrio sp. 1176]MDI6713811.1 chemotaxis protein CheW [Thermodesulfovibrio sp.]ODA43640.1 Positive regulator of CheA protein activity (CheW) [Thermodesulfovibrio sp. N1]
MAEEIKEEKQFCVFGIGEREFLIPKEAVIQIVDITRIFPIPGSPDYIVGALPVRGKIIPAIDLAKVYNVERINYADNKLLVIDVDGEKIGILSDITPFFVSFDKDIVVDDYIDPKKLYEELKVKQPTASNKTNELLP